jgi:hypothetical protein
MSSENTDRTARGIERRTFLKSTVATTAAGLGLFGSTGPAGALDPSEDSTEKPDITYKKVDRSVREVTAYYTLLTFSEDTVFSNIKNSDASPEEKREARDTLIDLRRKYPVRKEQDGNVTWLTLARENAQSTQEEREQFQKVNGVYRDGIPGRDEASTQWYTTDHSDHTWAAGQDVNVPSSDLDTIEQYSEEPDNITDGVEMPSSINHYEDVKAAFEYGLKKLIRHWDHFYNTGVYYSYWCYHDGHGNDFGSIGGAPRATQSEMDDAYWYDSYGYTTYRNQDLGRALHFVQDVANPLHAGEGWEQLGVYLYYDSSEDDNVAWGVDPNHTTHSRYEEYASDHWTSGDYFRLDFRSYDDCCYYSIYDSEAAVKGLADKAGEYSYDVYDTILNEENNAHWPDWSSSTRSEMEELTSYLIEEEGKYVRGFLKQFF